MRIYIITLHRAQNYGSILQTLALQNKIEELDLIIEAFNCFIIMNEDKAWKKVNKVKQLKEKYIELIKKEIND